MAINPETTERIITPMPKALIAAVDDYRFTNRLPSRAEAIRRLVELGLDRAPVAETSSATKSPIQTTEEAMRKVAERMTAAAQGRKSDE